MQKLHRRRRRAGTLFLLHQRRLPSPPPQWPPSPASAGQRGDARRGRLHAQVNCQRRIRGGGRDGGGRPQPGLNHRATGTPAAEWARSSRSCSGGGGGGCVGEILLLLLRGTNEYFAGYYKKWQSFVRKQARDIQRQDKSVSQLAAEDVLRQCGGRGGNYLRYGICQIFNKRMSNMPPLL